MKRIALIGAIALIPALAFGQKQAAKPAAKIKPVIREVIVKGYVAEMEEGGKVSYGRAIRISVERFDRNSQLTEAICSSGGDTILGKPVRFSSEHTSYYYNDRTLTAVTRHTTEGALIDSVASKPGDKAVPVNWYKYTSTGAPLRRATYIIDKNGNWTRMVTYHNGAPSRIIERVIYYYK